MQNTDTADRGPEQDEPPAEAPGPDTDEVNEPTSPPEDDAKAKNDDEAHAPAGSKYLAFKAEIEKVVADSGACSSCRLTALSEIMGDMIVKEGDDMAGIMELGSSVTKGIRAVAMSKMMADDFSKPSGFELKSKVYTVDVAGIDPLAAAVLRTVLGGGLRI